MRSLEDKHCTWTLRAPPAHRAYLRDLEIIRTSADSSGFGNSDTFNDAPRIEVYDGPKIDETKKLFRWVDVRFRGCWILRLCYILLLLNKITLIFNLLFLMLMIVILDSAMIRWTTAIPANKSWPSICIMSRLKSTLRKKSLSTMDSQMKKYCSCVRREVRINVTM